MMEETALFFCGAALGLLFAVVVSRGLIEIFGNSEHEEPLQVVRQVGSRGRFTVARNYRSLMYEVIDPDDGNRCLSEHAIATRAFRDAAQRDRKESANAAT